jgi:hypothetical protein
MKCSGANNVAEAPFNTFITKTLCSGVCFEQMRSFRLYVLSWQRRSLFHEEIYICDSNKLYI